mgnify:CR=1 FL=1
MKVLIVGSGGREHAIAYSVAKSSKVDKIYCAPGNAGIGQIAECVDITAMEFGKLAAFAKEKEIDLTIHWWAALWTYLKSRDFVSLAQEKMQPSLKDPKRFPKIL